jgi:hypothetical protein
MITWMSEQGVLVVKIGAANPELNQWLVGRRGRFHGNRTTPHTFRIQQFIWRCAMTTHTTTTRSANQRLPVAVLVTILSILASALLINVTLSLGIKHEARYAVSP